MKLFVFDDRVADSWRPFALTRPVGEIRFGADTLRGRIERWTGMRAAGAFSRAWLSDFAEAGAPPVIPRQQFPVESGVMLISSRFVPEDDAPQPATPGGDGTVVFVCGDDPVGCLVRSGEVPDAVWMLDPEEVPGARIVEVPGRLLAAPWHLVQSSTDTLARDVLLRAAAGTAPVDLAGVHVLGDGPVVLGRDVSIEPGVVLDTRAGGILLDDRTEVRTGTRIAGPFAADADCRLLGGALTGVSAGVRSYLRGEVEDSITLGYVNKSHDGFLGHAVVGRWVNLGALTTNSDLKNNYSSVSIGGPAGPVDTGLLKLGCLLGDHVRTAIGTLLTTGAVVGAGACLFGPRMPERWVPPFAWGSEGTLGSYELERFLQTAGRVSERRDVEFDDRSRAYLTACRQAALGDAGSL